MAVVDLDVGAWSKTLGQLCRFHSCIQSEVKQLIATIRSSMDESLVPKAEERANFGKAVKQTIRDMWALEYEIEDLQTEFVKSLGSIDLDNLTDDVVEDIMLQSKPLQAVLLNIRARQQERLDEVRKIYEAQIGELEPLAEKRPPKAEEEERLRRRQEMMKQQQEKIQKESKKEEKKDENNDNKTEANNEANSEANTEANKEANTEAPAENNEEGNAEANTESNAEANENGEVTVEVPSIAIEEAPQ